MKPIAKVYLSLLFTVFIVSSVQASDLVKVDLFDGATLTGKLQLPENPNRIKQLVIFVHGTGPSTYLDRKQIRGVDFNYYDLFAEEFNRRGIAFFSYNKRGVEISDQPPDFYTIDRDKFGEVIPNVEVNDLSRTIKLLRKDQRLKKAKIVLLGWSEGTIIASMLAENEKNRISALLLAGYAHENMFSVIKWQHSGESSMINLNRFFDKNADKRISYAEYNSKDKSATAMRTRGMGNAKFEQIDIDKDKFISVADFKLIVAPKYKMILEKIEAKDDDWIWRNYFRVSTNWLNAHFKLEANKNRLLRINKPIHIFHGEDDASTDVNGVYRLKASFAERGKTNLRTYVFKGHNHDLNFLDWAIRKKMPEGITKLFETAEWLEK